jgi:hypothetical protein
LEQEARIKDLEEKLQQVKIDEGNLHSFKGNKKKVRSELKEYFIDMYAPLHMFQDLVVIIINQHSTVKRNLTQFNIIREGMNNIDTWIVENLDTHVELYCPLARERKIDTYARDHYQQMGQKENKETTSSIAICSHIHKATQKLLKLCRLPQLEELGKNIIMEEPVDKVQDNTSRRRGFIEVATTFTMDHIEKDLIQPTKVHTMVHAFMTT